MILRTITHSSNCCFHCLSMWFKILLDLWILLLLLFLSLKEGSPHKRNLSFGHLIFYNIPHVMCIWVKIMFSFAPNYWRFSTRLKMIKMMWGCEDETWNVRKLEITGKVWSKVMNETLGWINLTSSKTKKRFIYIFRIVVGSVN